MALQGSCTGNFFFAKDFDEVRSYLGEILTLRLIAIAKKEEEKRNRANLNIIDLPCVALNMQPLH